MRELTPENPSFGIIGGRSKPGSNEFSRYEEMGASKIVQISDSFHNFGQRNSQIANAFMEYQEKGLQQLRKELRTKENKTW